MPGPHKGLRIGLFGGSFNPAHEGHRHVAETALKRLQLDWVWWIVARGNPLKVSHGHYGARLASAEIVARHPRMRVSTIERDLNLTYTHDVIRLLEQRCRSTRFAWIMGADSLSNFHRWASWREIAKQVPIAVITRPGAGPAARMSRFCNTFNTARRPEMEAAGLADADPPAWTVLKAPLNAASSTALRKPSHV
ncbi:MAG: nicotinate-nucleotide adenylyltransferase [Pseudomonadota bacterium]